VEYRPMIRSDATLGNVGRELQTFKPHVVHFEGYLMNSSTPDPNDTSITFYFGSNGYMSVEAFAYFLKNNGVQLLVVGRNSMAALYQNLGARATFRLIQEGVPAVIAPMRAIDDASATTFTTEFYRAFLQGNSLESSLHLARRKLASKGGDWSVFALFADPAQLDHFQLLRETVA
jgi:CHAT domain-containing protein